MYRVVVTLTTKKNKNVEDVENGNHYLNINNLFIGLMHLDKLLAKILMVRHLKMTEKSSLLSHLFPFILFSSL